MEELDTYAMIRDNRQISIQLEQVARRAIAQKGVTGIQAHLLLYILAHTAEGTSLTEIHREFGYSMAAMSAVVKRLREKGYVRSEPCARDDRRKLLFATDKGEEVREFLDNALLRARERLYRDFSREELTALDCLQKKMLRNLAALAQSDCKEATQP